MKDSENRLLQCIGSFIHGKIRIDPSRRYGIHSCFSCQTDRQCMCQCGNSSLCCCITFCLRLTHTISGGRNIDNRSTFCQMILKQFRQIKRCCHTNCKRILELFIRTFFQPLHKRQCIMNQYIHMTILLQNIRCKIFQGFLLTDVSHIMFSICLINHNYLCTFSEKGFCNGLADSMGSTGYYNYFIFKIQFITSGGNNMVK